MNLRKRHQEAIPLRHPGQAKPVPIVSDGLVATGAVGEGRMLPVVVLDTSERPDIEGVMLAHHHLGSGDVRWYWPVVRSRWRQRSTRLGLTFLRPSQCVVILEFDLEEQGPLVDQILHARGLWIQTGRNGDRPSTLLDKRRLLVEVGLSQEFRRVWDSMFEKAMIRRFRRKGLRRAKAKRAGRELISRWRETFQERLPVGLEHVRPNDEDQERAHSRH